ncbi:MAG: helix-turn-helix domain-containing protein [Ardenticatenaceae bacterium]|nr:helix-turn-helix domain-containing protein [Ardenticatenaceae bacterium]MCB9444891.1 helix-turn-helix domain-containing protein [Ardenticatenaceae bacterium]
MADYLLETEQWMTLSQAAKHLNVHPTTLRRWADNGDIPFMLTPGGHRRFSTVDIQDFADGRRQLRRAQGLEEMWAERAMVETRQQIATKQDRPWMARYDADRREEHRVLGQQLMGLTLQYVSDPNGNGSILKQARAIGLEYGRLAIEENLPLTDALQAAMFFRDMLIEVALQLPEETRIQPQANLRLMRRINELLNTVNLAIAETYQ